MKGYLIVYAIWKWFDKDVSLQLKCQLWMDGSGVLKDTLHISASLFIKTLPKSLKFLAQQYKQLSQLLKGTTPLIMNLFKQKGTKKPPTFAEYDRNAALYFHISWDMKVHHLLKIRCGPSVTSYLDFIFRVKCLSGKIQESAFLRQNLVFQLCCIILLTTFSLLLCSLLWLILPAKKLPLQICFLLHI